MKKILKLPEDAALLDRLMASALKLTKDSDRDVQQSASSVSISKSQLIVEMSDVLYKMKMAWTEDEESTEKRKVADEDAVQRMVSLI
jgi:hypothetical protein